MVHALTKVHGLLGENGRLLNIHPRGNPTPIEVRAGSVVTRVGQLREESDGVDYMQASAAINAVIARKLFALEREGAFNFTVFADSLAGLHAYLENERTGTYLDEPETQRITELMKDGEVDQEIMMRNVIRVWRLRPL